MKINTITVRAEVWRPVIHAEWAQLGYEVSSFGRVRHGAFVMKLRVMPKGYIGVRFCNKGRRKYFLVHRLVAEAFVGIIPPKMEVNHIKPDKAENLFSNLEIVTSLKNKAHAKLLGLMCFGSRHGRAKLSEADVAEARRKYKAGGFSFNSLARIYGVAKATMKDALKGKTWSHVTNP